MGRFLDSLSEQVGYEEFRYVMQDSGSYYIGAKYNYAECIENEDVPFKFKAIIEHYIAKDTDMDTLLESQLYYLTKDQFSYKTLKQLKARVKISLLVEKTFLWKKTGKYVYKEQIVSIEDLVDMNLAYKKGRGVIIMELILSKLALMSFSV